MQKPRFRGKYIHLPWMRRIGETTLIGFSAYYDLVVFVNNSQDVESLHEWTAWHSLPSSMSHFVIAIVYPMLFLRWRYPRVTLITFWTAHTLIYLLWGLDALALGLFVALYPLARRGSPRAALTALILHISLTTTLIFIGTILIPAPYFIESPQPDVLYFVESAVTNTFMIVLVWGAGRLIYSVEARGEQEKRQQMMEAVRAERLYLARELHDIVSHSVSAMILQAAGAKALASSENAEVKAALDVIENTGIEAMVELHRLLGLLRAASPMDYRDGTEAPASLQDLEALVGSTRASGVDVEVSVEGHPAELDRSVGLTAYRIVQEALTNTIKHAGRGAAAQVHLRWEPEYLKLTIRDRAGLGAQGMTALSFGHGLAGLRERVSLVGGFMEAGSTPDGFLLRAQLPTQPSTLHQSSLLTDRKD